MAQCPNCHLTLPDPAGAAGQTAVCPACGQSFVALPRFDPYYTWLGIPPEDQPPHCYRLLGLALFEANPQVIENAADRQMMHLRSFQGGARSADSQRLLNEVASARVRLLDPAQRVAYDEQLRLTLVPRPAGAEPIFILNHQLPATGSRPAADTETLPAQSPARARPAPQKPSSSGKKAKASPLGIVFGGIAGIVLGLLVVVYLMGQGLIGGSRNSRPQSSRFATGDAPTSRPAKSQPQPLPFSANNGSVRSPFSTSAVPLTDDAAAGTLGPSPEPLGKSTPQLAVEPAEAASAPPLPAGTTAPTPTESQRSTPYLFAEVPSLWRPPPLISTAAVPLLKLAYQPAEPLMLTIHSAAANLPVNAAIVAEEDLQGRGWIISFVNDGQAAANKIVLAIVRREGLELTFAWTAPSIDSELKRQVTNCLLEVGTVKDTRVMQLREPALFGPLLLDLEKDNQIVEIDLADPPPPGKLNLKIVELSGFERGGKLRGGVDKLPLGKTAYIEFTDMKGAQVELRFLRQSAAGKLLLRCEPVFKEGGDKEFELTLPRLDKFRAGHESSLAKANAEIPVLQKNLTDAQSTLRSLQSKRPSNVQEAAMRGPQIAAAASVVDRLGQRISRLQRQVAESQARLKAVPEVRAFIQSMHQRATIKYVLSAQCGDKELILVDGQHPVSAQSAQKLGLSQGE
jgi:hypothetical protein